MIPADQPMKLAYDAWHYGFDAARRSILYWNVMRKRGNIYLEHIYNGQPPVLVFGYETIADGRNFDRPVNYALIRILDRRQNKNGGHHHDKTTENQFSEHRRTPGPERRHKPRVAHDAPEATSRPIVIMDPRAGHGPGIGGSKQESQIGMALDAGHPVYFIIFFTDPMPNQTVADVRNAQNRFIETICKLHPEARKPAIIGNCQGGWAAALIGAERPDLVGPMVFNGSPLSYWGGIEGVHPLRYLGGLWGGVWIASFLSDLGNNRFDGANLVANFENLNPANTLWEKQYNLYSAIDTEEKRYLDFEKWWGGFFSFSGEEIHTIIDSLFIGNRLEKGELELDKGRRVDLKHNNNPVVMFASFGDNITPPQQAFNWIIKTYGTVDEIKRRGQVIVFIDHEDIGHLGIFVSAKIARKEHKEIIASFDMLDWMPPGLYQMRIDEDPDEPGNYITSFFEKNMQDIRASLDHSTFMEALDDEKAFIPARKLSQINDAAYRLMVSPWIRPFVNELTAEILRQAHPMRMQRYWMSDLNPAFYPVGIWASLLRENGSRPPISEDNWFLEMERLISELIADNLQIYRRIRDGLWEMAFQFMYQMPWAELFQEPSSAQEIRSENERLEQLRRQDAMHWREQMDKGDLPEAVIRMLLAVGLADWKLGRRDYELVLRLTEENEEFKNFDYDALTETFYRQARILQTDTDLAIDTLPSLLPTKVKRKKALSILEKVTSSVGRKAYPSEALVLDRIKSLLGK